ncbi:MAG: hypothetical protein ACREXX_11300 [Gammaproteobacteria bacterium]
MGHAETVVIENEGVAGQPLDIMLLKWMLGILIAGVVSLILSNHCCSRDQKIILRPVASSTTREVYRA